MMYQINNEVKKPEEVAHFISTLTRGVTITNTPLDLGDRTNIVFSGASFMDYFLQSQESVESDGHHLLECLAYDCVQLDMTENRCFAEHSLLEIRRIVDILSKRCLVLILIRNTEDLERNYESMFTSLKYNSIMISDIES